MFWHFWVAGRGTPKVVDNYYFVVRLYTDGISSYQYEGPVVSWDQSITDVLSNGHGLILTEVTMQQLNRNSKFSFDLDIYPKDKIQM